MTRSAKPSATTARKAKRSDRTRESAGTSGAPADDIEAEERAAIIVEGSGLAPIVEAVQRAAGAPTLEALDEIERALQDHEDAVTCELASRPRREARSRDELDELYGELVKASRASTPEEQLAKINRLREAFERARQELTRYLPPERFTLTQALRSIEEIPWLCRAFQWTKGRPNLVIGFAGDGKTTAALSVLISFALGWPAWGRGELKATRLCRGLYVDLDMGAPAAQARLREVALGMGVTDEHLESARGAMRAAGVKLGPEDDVLEGRGGEGLVLVCSSQGGDTPVPKDLQTFRAAWMRAVRGFDLVLIDSFGKLAPMMHHMDAKLSLPLIELRHVSVATGVVFVILQHSPKAPGKGLARPEHMASKGPSSIDADSGSHLTIFREKDRRRVKLTRGAELDWRPLEGHLDKRAPRAACVDCEGDGSRCTRCGGSGIDPQETSDGRSRIVFSPVEPSKADEAKPAVVREAPADDIELARETLKKNPGIAGKKNLAAALVGEHKSRHPRAKQMSKERSRDAVAALEARGEIHDRPVTVDGRQRPRWYWRDPSTP